MNTEGITRTGDLVVYNADLPCETQPHERYRHDMLVVPKQPLDPYLPLPGRPLAAILRGHSGVEALAAIYLDALTQNWDSIPAATMGQVADTPCRLIGVACGAAAAAQPDAVRTAG